MNALKLLSGGAAQGLVAGLEPKFNSITGYRIEGVFGAVGVMSDKLRRGEPADVVVLTAAIIADLAKEGFIVPNSISNVGLVETALAVRSKDHPVTVKDTATLRAVLLAADAVFVPDMKTSTAGIHVAKILRELGIESEMARRLRIFPNGATAMRHLAESNASRPIGCTQSTEILATAGVILAGKLPKECELSTLYTAAVTKRAANAPQAQILIDLVVGSEQRGLRERAGFLSSHL